ncbi:hypothetical protein [Geminocystis sp. GBBB08]|uniref:hypothetical protein n=1 Tax=Geminocystis sp. GBBB08 TaxID=2604140 RepID=UPI0027E2D051|nr:hypothetical protein [Geminocystis sp. GBBB08]MBL1210646.1 transcriptional regulator [Geminocystis sp. GBBB08]
MATSNNYHQYLIESLKDKTEAANYLWAILQEEQTEPQLLEIALNNILEALGTTCLSTEEIKQQKAKINQLLNQSGSAVIYSLAEWLQKLGLELSVNINNQSKLLISSQISNDNLKVLI